MTTKISESCPAIWQKRNAWGLADIECLTEIKDRLAVWMGQNIITPPP